MKLSIKYVERNVSRHGQVRYYFRRSGKRIGRIEGEPGSTSFLEQYNAYLDGKRPSTSTNVPDVKVITQGTFGALCRLYTSGMAFKRLDASTQNKRRAIIERMLEEPVNISEPEGHMFAEFPIAHLERSDLEVLRDRKASTPFAADERVKVLGQIFKHATRENVIKYNIAADVERFRQQSEGHMPATWEDVKKYREFHGTDSMAWLALTILLFTGIRVSDLVTLGRQHRKGEYLNFRMAKGKSRRPVDMKLFLHPVLQYALDAVPNDRLTYIVTEHGQPFGNAKTMSDRVSKWFKQAGMVQITAHSIRKLVSIELAENGATDEEMNGALGWTSAQTSKIYTRKANRAILSKNALSRLIDGKTATPEVSVWQIDQKNKQNQS